MRTGPALAAAAVSDVASSYAYKHAAAASQQSGAGSVFDRLTDTRGFTGTHKHRFDKTGRGLGLRGRDSSDIDYEWVRGQSLNSATPIFSTNDAGSLAFGVKRYV